ncbi:hypothetical protein ACFC3O_31645 [Streptomyces sp. NPDC056007]|uniref:hypothetical protein n=1 Tax=Streptomyces sp. NPDC056007 TaxID=3345678 RepID=UPI0035DA23ED
MTETMPRNVRSDAEIAEVRAELMKNKDAVITAYYGGTTKTAICRTYKVDDKWLARQFAVWGVRERSRSEIGKLANPKGSKRRASRSPL